MVGCKKIGTAFIINIPNSKVKLIHCPTMIEPSIIKKSEVVKRCMIATLQTAVKYNIKSIVIPAFGGLTGRVEPNVLAKLMHEGYIEFKEKC